MYIFGNEDYFKSYLFILCKKTLYLSFQADAACPHAAPPVTDHAGASSHVHHHDL
ncbi:hypothetical protein MSKU15_0544 [Komagataeibacter diospyri]|uniref:Uncharacterized protein n=1 Tax=Komagataeibacter diospyri TaxID=1932662 RepID=A0A4P5NR29_9PROT|nr:hypothetical protein MSKU9_0745 [Komagataeibacter diospyri]GCE88943.1 hypothetical protein MSKU15_0544 [Komagataeibacter diospyri]